MIYQKLISYIEKHNQESAKNGCNTKAYYDMVYDLLDLCKDGYYIDEVNIDNSYIELWLYDKRGARAA